jgi:hypothetical protein
MIIITVVLNVNEPGRVLAGGLRLENGENSIQDKGGSRAAASQFLTSKAA